ncbi:hypothetical protein RCL1_001381 [Eukaryota sp. TZLM3-RCL]
MNFPQPQNLQEIRRKFDLLDRNKNHSLSVTEIITGYSTTTRQFPVRTARLLIRCFSTRSEVSFEEFINLDTFINTMKSSFASMDTNRSGNINSEQMLTALAALGFSFLSPISVGNLLRVYNCPFNAITFEAFIDMGVLLNFLYHLFRTTGIRPNNTIELSFDQLVSFALMLT